MTQSATKNKKIIIYTIIAIIIAIVIGLATYFIARPSIRKVKFTALSFEENCTYVYIKLDASSHSEIAATDFAIYAEGFPITSFAFKDTYWAESHYRFEHSGTYRLTLIFQLNQEQIDLPILVLYKGKSIM